jgi:uncharacterized membrane protein
MIRRTRGLSEADWGRLEKRAELLESRTGIQVVVTVTPRSDAYPEIPWKAFSLGVAVASPVALLLAGSVGAASMGMLTMILAFGLLLALLAIFVPCGGRLLLGRARAEQEVLQRAEGIFLERELFRTRERHGVLLLASLYERRLVLLADARVRATLGPDELACPVSAALPFLSRGLVAEGMEIALGELEARLLARGFSGGGGDELGDEVIVDPRGEGG